MEIEFGSNRLQKQMSSATAIKTAYGERAKKVTQRLDEIASAPNLAVLIQLPFPNCHPLTGDKKGEWAVDISGNHRIIFIINHETIPHTDNDLDTSKVTKIKILKTEDYH